MSLMSPGPSTPLPHHFLVVCSPHNPPYEQLLVGMGVGPVALGVIVWPWWWLLSLSYGPGAPAIHLTSSCSLALCWCRCQHWCRRWVVMVGPWCSFLLVIGIVVGFCLWRLSMSV